MEKIPFITIYVPKDIFAKIYRKRWFQIDFEPDLTILQKNEFVRIKTDFNKDWFADFKISKIVCKENAWQIFLGEQIYFYAKGTREVRWFQKNFKNKEENDTEN